MASGIIGNITDYINKPGLETKVGFFRMMAITSNAGLGTRDALRVIILSEKNKQMREIVRILLDIVNEGGSLSDAFMEVPYFFKKQEISLIRAAEGIGNLPQVLLGIAVELEQSQKLQGKVKSAMTYPTVVLLFAIIAIVVLLIKVIPVIVSLFPSQDDLPGVTQLMINISDYLQNYRYIPLGILIALVTAYIIAYRYLTPFKMLMDGVFLRAPVIGGVVRNMNLYRFSKMMADFSNAGVSLVDSVENIARTLDNYHYKKRVERMSDDLFVGLTMVDSVEGSDLFPPILTQIIDIGEKTGNLGEVLEKMAVYYKDSLENSIEGTMKLIEPLLMGFVAIIIGTIVASVFLPMADLINVVGG